MAPRRDSSSPLRLQCSRSGSSYARVMRLFIVTRQTTIEEEPPWGSYSDRAWATGTGSRIRAVVRRGTEPAGGVVDAGGRRPVEPGHGHLSRRLRDHGRQDRRRAGQVIEPGTIVVRRGMIEAVGPAKDVTVPYDAETIDGKGLVVYPGIHRPVHDGRPASRGRAVGDRARAGRSTWPRRRLISTPPDNRRGLDARIRGRRRARADRRPGRATATAGIHRFPLGPRAARSRPARAPWSA